MRVTSTTFIRWRKCRPIRRRCLRCSTPCSKVVIATCHHPPPSILAGNVRGPIWVATSPNAIGSERGRFEREREKVPQRSSRHGKDTVTARVPMGWGKPRDFARSVLDLSCPVRKVETVRVKINQSELKLTLYAIPYESTKAASQPPRFEPEPSQPTQSGSRGCAGEQVTQDWVQWGRRWGAEGVSHSEESLALVCHRAGTPSCKKRSHLAKGRMATSVVPRVPLNSVGLVAK